MIIFHCMYSYTVLIYLTAADNPEMKISDALVLKKPLANTAWHFSSTLLHWSHDASTTFSIIAIYLQVLTILQLFFFFPRSFWLSEHLKFAYKLILIYAFIFLQNVTGIFTSIEVNL